MPDIVATRQQLAAQQQKPVKTEADAPQPNGEEAPPQPAAAATTTDAMEVGLGVGSAGRDGRGVCVMRGDGVMWDCGTPVDSECFPTEIGRCWIVCMNSMMP